MVYFLNRYYLPKLNQDQRNNLNKDITIKKWKQYKKSPTQKEKKTKKKIPVQNSTRHSRKT